MAKQVAEYRYSYCTNPQKHAPHAGFEFLSPLALAGGVPWLSSAAREGTCVRVQGWPVGTFVRGKQVMWQGEVTTPSLGEPVRFLETLKP